MLKNIFKHTLRNVKRHRSSFVINLIGLSTGLASALLIFLWVNDELQMDNFHEKADRLHQVMEHQEYVEGIMTTMSTPGILAEELKAEIPEIEHSATLNWRSQWTISVDDVNIKAYGYWVDADFFRMFTFPLLEGNPENMLIDWSSAVVSRNTAENFFGSVTNAIGKSIEWEHEESYVISGVFENPPDNSTLQFDILLPYQKYKSQNTWLQNYDSNSPRTIVTLVEGADVKAVNRKIANFIKERKDDSNVTLFLQPYKDRYLHSRFENGKLAGGRIDYVRLFSLIAIFVLIIACINYMNLSTARASRRAKEIGVRKTVGAGKRSLVNQFLGESVGIAVLSLVLAYLLVALALPEFNFLTDKEIKLRLTPQLVLVSLAITVFTGLLAGSYPAFYLSSFQPTAVLKGEIRKSIGEIWARRGLVIFQFTLSAVLIVSVIVVYRQVQFAQNKNLGYAKDQLVHFAIDGRIETNTDAFLQQAGQLPGIESISTVAHDFVGRQNNTSGLNWDGKNPEDRILFEHVRVNYDLLETIEVEFVEGRPFLREFGADSNKIIFNETAIRIMGMEEPLGKRIRLWDEYDFEIIGVVKDFHFQSLHETMKPMFFRLTPESTWMVMARLDAGMEQEALQNLKSFYEEFNPGFPFEYTFVDEEYASQYAAERRVSSLSRYFAGFAILISCLGLFGLAAFTADRKRKEIGIRKVLGATVMNIIGLLTKDFTRLVIISLVIGLPVSYFIVNRWLHNFAYKIDLNPLFFMTAGILVLTISWLTVSSQAYRSATVNPRECLRDE
jgi:putative ABC transport system permease protein